jgi:phosphoribosylamine--glycine ligase
MIVDGRPVLLEYNARFGDPEAQVILPLLENDLPDILEACAAGTLAGYLAGQPLRWRPGAAVCVVAASKGYPGEYQTGFPITDPYAEVLDTHLFHAGTALEEGEVVTAGGRVLCAVGLGTGSAKASWRAYGLISQIKFANKTYRSDIG